jgi:glycosyltransferase involved in cell wall biosynthesis
MCDLGMTGMLSGATDALRVYHAQNVEAVRWREAGPRLLAREHWARVMTTFERRAVATSDLTVVCTDEDAAQMRALHGAHDVEVIPNGYDETVLRPADAAARARARTALGIAPDAQVAAFVGGDWGANHEALAFLRREVAPRLAAEGGVLLAVGGASRRLVGLREPGLVAVGETDDLGAVLAAADVGLNPMTSGGGSNVKVPTYLALGLAVITTPFGMRGYAPLASAVEVAPLEGFVDAVRRRSQGWAALGAPAPAALADYAWGALGARLADRFAARLAARREGAA